ncbi:MAG: DUF2807 domain-containing protein [Rikenellaceae bacterium]
MRHLISTLLLIFSLCNIYAQNKVENKLTDFKSISVVGNIELTLVKGDTPSFEAEITGVAADKLEWTISSNKVDFFLKEPLKFGSNKETVSAKVTLYYTDLETVDCRSSAKILSKDVIKSEIFTINARTNSVVSLNLDSEDVRVTGSSSVVTLSGKTDYLTVDSSSAASVNCSMLDSRVVTAKTQTNAECYVSSSEKLDAKASTNSSLFYKGEPKFFNKKESTLGEVLKF